MYLNSVLIRTMEVCQKGNYPLHPYYIVYNLRGVVVLHRKPCICDICYAFAQQKNSSNAKGFL